MSFGLEYGEANIEYLLTLLHKTDPNNQVFTEGDQPKAGLYPVLYRHSARKIKVEAYSPLTKKLRHLKSREKACIE